MSLINQMLRDLESRRAIDERATLPNDVRPLPPPRRPVMPRVLAIGTFFVVLASGAILWTQLSPAPAELTQAQEEKGKSAQPVTPLAKVESQAEPVVKEQPANSVSRPRETDGKKKVSKASVVALPS